MPVLMVGLPPFVTAEFRKFLRCGVLAHGFARVRCRDCAFERLALLYHEVLAPNARWRGGGARRGGEHGSPSRGVRDTGRRSRVRRREAGLQPARSIAPGRSSRLRLSPSQSTRPPCSSTSFRRTVGPRPRSRLARGHLGIAHAQHRLPAPRGRRGSRSGCPARCLSQRSRGGSRPSAPAERDRRRARGAPAGARPRAPGRRHRARPPARPDDERGRARARDAPRLSRPRGRRAPRPAGGEGRARAARGNSSLLAFADSAAARASRSRARRSLASSSRRRWSSPRAIVAATAAILSTTPAWNGVLRSIGGAGRNRSRRGPPYALPSPHRSPPASISSGSSSRGSCTASSTSARCSPTAPSPSGSAQCSVGAPGGRPPGATGLSTTGQR